MTQRRALSTYLEDADYRRLAVLAKKSDRTLAAEARWAILQHLNKPRRGERP